MVILMNELSTPALEVERLQCYLVHSKEPTYCTVCTVDVYLRRVR